MVLQDAVVPHHLFVEQLEAFLQAQNEHLLLEETSIFPMICERFTVDDWQQVEALYTGDDGDPVFGDTIADQYAQLAQRVRSSEQETM